MSEIVNCRAQVSPDCKHGKAWLDDPEGSIREDGTWDGETIVCNPCYVALMPLTRSGQGLLHELPDAIEHAHMTASDRPHPAHRDARMETITFADLRVGDFITAEPELGHKARWVEVTGINEHPPYPGGISISFRTPESISGRRRYVMDRDPADPVVVDAGERGPE